MWLDPEFSFFDTEADHAFEQVLKFEQVNINSGITLGDISTPILNA